MKDIALYKTIFINETEGVHLQQYILSGKPADVYKLDLTDFDVLQYSKFVDGDLLELQLSHKFLDELCDAWISYRQSNLQMNYET